MARFKGEFLMRKFTIDNEIYEVDEVNPTMQSYIDSIEFANKELLQRNNELQIALTAKIGYTRALEREINKSDK